MDIDAQILTTTTKFNDMGCNQYLLQPKDLNLYLVKATRTVPGDHDGDVRTSRIN